MSIAKKRVTMRHNGRNCNARMHATESPLLCLKVGGVEKGRQQKGRNLAGGCTFALKHVLERFADDGIAESQEGQKEHCGRYAHVRIAVFSGKFLLDCGNEVADRFFDTAEVFDVSGKRNPGRELACTAFIEGVEDHVDERARSAGIRFEMCHRVVQRHGQIAYHLCHECRLQLAGRAKMMEKIAVGHAEFGRQTRKRDGIRPFCEEKMTGRRKRFTARLLWRAATADRNKDGLALKPRPRCGTTADELVYSHIRRIPAKTILVIYM